MTDSALVRPKARSEYADVAAMLEHLRAMDCGSGEAEALREQVITRCLPLASHIARRFRDRGEPLEDLIQIARLGLVGAVDRFDPARGIEFLSFAVPTIMGEVRRYFRDAGWGMRVPRGLKERHLQISEATGRLAQHLGRAPSASEIATELKLSMSEVAEGLLVRGAYRAESMDSASTGDSDGLALAEGFGAEDPGFDRIDGLVSIRPMLAKLPVKEREILMMRFFDSMTQTQIAQRVGMSQMHVSRILSKTLAQLRANVSE